MLGSYWARSGFDWARSFVLLGKVIFCNWAKVMFFTGQGHFLLLGKVNFSGQGHFLLGKVILLLGKVGFFLGKVVLFVK